MIKIYIYLLLLLLLLTACYEPIDPDLLNQKYKSNILLETNIDSIAADGKSIVEIKVLIPKEAAIGKRSVILNTTRGTFPEGNGKSITVEANQIDSKNENKRVVSVKLQSDISVGNANITSKYLNISSEPLSIKFFRAYPDSGTIEADKFAIHNNYISEATITTTILRTNDGKPSIGQGVRFEVLDSLGNPLNVNYRSESKLTNENGKASVIVSSGYSYLGKVIIKGIFEKNFEKDSITVTNYIFVTKEKE